MSLGEIERLTRRYTFMISPLLGPEKDIPAPDVYTNPQTMAWIMDTFSMLKGYTVPGVVTGKPLDLGGSLGRNEGDGAGAAYSSSARRARSSASTLAKATAAVQGYGNAGAVYRHPTAARTGREDRRRQRQQGGASTTRTASMPSRPVKSRPGRAASPP